MTDHLVKRLVLRLPDSEHRALKTFAAMTGKSIQGIIIEALALFYQKEAKTMDTASANLTE